MLETSPLDEVLTHLSTWPARGARRAARPVLDASIAATERLIRRLQLAPDTCLYRSMGRYALLRANGVSALFCLGVRPPPDSTTGHAWVEDEGGPYLEEIEDGGYVVTFSHPTEHMG